ncbi:MAG: lipopolysaccharide transport periplasmic protein LptA [Paracoccaceae bacterium]
MARTVPALAALPLILAAAVALAQEPGPFGGFKHDNKAPIEITSDALEVRQSEQLAIFSGQVVAGQGTLRLTADRVVVRYDEDQTDSETGAIQNLSAEGNVFLSNGAETAQGSRAEYDVVEGMMFMTGQVLLTQGRNAVAGDRLRINMNTGVAQMVGNRTAEGAPQAGGQGRVRSVFVPSSRGQSN